MNAALNESLEETSALREALREKEGTPQQRVLTEEEQQLVMRELLGVDAQASTIQIQFKSEASQRQKKLDYERVMRVRQKIPSPEIEKDRPTNKN